MNKLIYIVFLLFGLSWLTIYSQNDSIDYTKITKDDIMQMSVDDLLALPFENLLTLANKLGISIDDLLNMKTSVASKNALTPRESPGIISIITADEIKHSGARDLMDVLSLVPGINFAWDADGVVGIQMRGNWAFEGKVSILIDGQEMNDLKYYIVPFGHHFSVDQIQRIEVIRGPGSSIYGGTAELGVINIITKSGEDLKGLEAFVSYGIEPTSSSDSLTIKPGNRRAAFNVGDKIGDFKFSVTSSIIEGNRSNRFYHADSGIYINCSDSVSHLSSKNINVNASYKGLSARFIFDNYYTRYFYQDEESGGIYPNEFKTWLGELKYDWKINNNLTLTPKYNIKRSIPYFEEGYEGNLDLFRNELGVSGNYLLKNGSSIIAGVDYYNDLAICMEETPDSYIYFKDDSSYHLSFNNISAFAQAFIKLGKLNIIAGGRIDNHSEYGTAIAPRLGLTSVFNKFHFKLLVSRAFRSPSFGNITFQPDLEPEYTWVGELEAGYKINNNMFFTTNLYYTRIENSIVWYDSTEYNEDSYGYTNAGKTGTYGIECEYRALYSRGSVMLNYSYYSCEGLNEINDYKDPSSSSRFMGSPNHKIALTGSFNITKNSFISPSIIYRSGAHSYGGYNEAEEDQGYIWFEPTCMVNLFYTIDIKGFSGSIGVKDILNSQKYYYQGYVGYESPFPAASREFILKLNYKFSWRK